MKLQLLDRSSVQNSSFTVNGNAYPHFLKVWHHHVEFELVFILKSTGTRFIGDSIEKFGPGEVILIGENLPHMWVNDDEYFEKDSTLIAEAVAIHFKYDFLGEHFFEIPETLPIRNLLSNARQGVRFENIDDDLKLRILDLAKKNSLDRLISFIEILAEFGRAKEFKLLSSSGFIKSFLNNESYKMQAVYEFVFENFKTPISLKDIASIAHMNVSAFSRAFKRIHRKTFTRYLTEIRLGYACRLLLENNKSIKEICYESGFNNASNFNVSFKRIKGMTPTQYISLYA